jgi:polar amino acid transport system substrate-binding protein
MLFGTKLILEGFMKKRLLSTVLVCAIVFMCGSIACAGAILDEVLKKGELVVGISGDQPPLNATTKEGEIIGLDADLARAIAASMNVKIRFSRMPFSELLTSLQFGKVDMIISGMTMTSDRNMKVAFIGPYHIWGKGILLKIKTVEMLRKEGVNSEKFKVATLKGSTSQAIVEKAAPKAGLVLAASYDEALNMLYQDKVDIVIADYPFCAYIADRYSEKELAVGDTKLSFEPLGIAIREDALWINALDNFLKMLVGSGDMTVLQEKWFKSRTWIKQLP